MGKKQNNNTTGFTIVEVVLFLGISGLLAVSLMVGWSVNINRQRYNDTVNTFKSSIQTVFSEVENTQNGREQKVKCATTGSSVQILSNSSGEDRGTTDCIIMGKMIIFRSCGGPGACSQTPGHSEEYEIRDIVGKDINISTDCGGKACDSDISALNATKFIISASNDSSTNATGNSKTERMEWSGAYKAATKTSNFSKLSGSFGQLSVSNAVYGVLIVRSPIDGTVRTFGTSVDLSKDPGDKVFSSPDVAKTFREKMVQTETLITNNKRVDMCVAPSYVSNGVADNSLFSRNKVVRIGNNSGSVEIAPLDSAGAVSCTGGIGFDGVIGN